MICRALSTGLVLSISLFTSFDGSSEKAFTSEGTLTLQVSKLLMTEEGRSVLLLLQPEPGEKAVRLADARKVLPLVIGMEEARSIGVALHKLDVPRPLSHDLMKKIIEEYKGSIQGCVITKMENETFFAELHLKRDGRELTIDCRPSDAIALSMRSGAPILVKRAVFDKYAVDPSNPPPERGPKA